MRWSVWWASLVFRGRVDGGLIWLSHTRAIQPGFSNGQYTLGSACGACSAFVGRYCRNLPARSGTAGWSRSKVEEPDALATPITPFTNTGESLVAQIVG